MSLRFDTEQRTRLRRALMKRGHDLATLLSDVLAGKKPASLQAMMSQKPGMRPEEVLRMALDQVEAQRKLIDADDDRYGRCEMCGFDLGFAAIGEVPWADRCHKHANQ